MLQKFKKCGCTLIATTLIMSVPIGVSASNREIMTTNIAENQSEIKKNTSFSSQDIEESYEIVMEADAEEFIRNQNDVEISTIYSEEDAKKSEKIVADETVIIGSKDSFEIGCYVTVSGKGNEASDGSGKLGCNWEKEKMMIVGIRENSEYPYACAIITDDPNVKDVMAWFKADNLEFFINKKIIVGPVVKKDGQVYVPAGYYIKGNLVQRDIVECPVYADDSKEEISFIYSIRLEK